MLLYSSPLPLIERECASVDLRHVCCWAKQHVAGVLFTFVANRPTQRVGRFATAVFTRDAALCTVLSTHVANKPTRSVGRFATRVLKNKFVLCTVLFKRIANRPKLLVVRFAKTVLSRAPANCIGRRFTTVDLRHVYCCKRLPIVPTNAFHL